MFSFGGGNKVERMPKISPQESLKGEALFPKMNRIFQEVVEKYDRLGVRAKDFAKKKEAMLAVFRDKFEKLNISEDISIIINEMYQNRLITKDEAQYLLNSLRTESGGEDNYATIVLLHLLMELDLDKKLNQE